MSPEDRYFEPIKTFGRTLFVSDTKATIFTMMVSDATLKFDLLGGVTLSIMKLDADGKFRIWKALWLRAES